MRKIAAPSSKISSAKVALKLFQEEAKGAHASEVPSSSPDFSFRFAEVDALELEALVGSLPKLGNEKVCWCHFTVCEVISGHFNTKI